MQILTEGELSELEGTLLPALERHHLRLLAHGLRTLQVIAARRHGAPPDRSAIAAWVEDQAEIAGDPGFRGAFAAQLLNLADQLGVIAREAGKDPMALDLSDLATWARHHADDRITRSHP